MFSAFIFISSWKRGCVDVRLIRTTTKTHGYQLSRSITPKNFTYFWIFSICFGRRYSIRFDQYQIWPKNNCTLQKKNWRHIYKDEKVLLRVFKRNIENDLQPQTILGRRSLNWRLVMLTAWIHWCLLAQWIKLINKWLKSRVLRDFRVYENPYPEVRSENLLWFYFT
jgi:hypothetical protein